MTPAHAASFYVPWTAALAASASLPSHLQPFTIAIAGLQVPVVTCGLGAIGVLAARPLAHKQESTIGFGNFLLVSAILLIAIELWILQSKPDWLFAFVVSVGLGFTGFSVIELLGDEIREVIRQSGSLVTNKLKVVLGMASKGSQNE